MDKQIEIDALRNELAESEARCHQRDTIIDGYIVELAQLKSTIADLQNQLRGDA